MIEKQTTTLIFEYPQDYLQEQEWRKTKGDRWVHKSEDTIGSVYENTLSYSIGAPAGRKTKRKKDEQLPPAKPGPKWNQLRETISEMAENGGDGTQEDVCRYLLKYMDELEQED